MEDPVHESLFAPSVVGLAMESLLCQLGHLTKPSEIARAAEFVAHKKKQNKRKEPTMNPAHFKKLPILLLPIVLGLVALTFPGAARADAVTDWNAIASNAIVATAGQPPPVAALHFTMVHAAV